MRRAIAAGTVQSSDGNTFGVPSLGSIGSVSTTDVPRVEDCDPGFHPSEYNVLLIMPVIREKAGSLLLADETKEKLGDAMQLARIVGASPIAFNFDRFPAGTKPKVGDLVWFARYAGGMMTGRDGRVYRIIKDKDVMGVLDPPAVQKTEEAADDAQAS